MRLSDCATPKWTHRLFIAYLVVMLLVFLTPTPDTGIESKYSDKIIHFVLFFGFAMVYHFDRRAKPGQTVLVASLFAAGVELAQWPLPFREFEVADLLAGLAGVALAMLIVLVYRASAASDSRGA